MEKSEVEQICTVYMPFLYRINTVCISFLYRIYTVHPRTGENVVKLTAYRRSNTDQYPDSPFLFRTYTVHAVLTRYLLGTYSFRAIFDRYSNGVGSGGMRTSIGNRCFLQIGSRRQRTHTDLVPSSSRLNRSYSGDIPTNARTLVSGDVRTKY